MIPNIIYIPGKNPKPEPEVHRALLWRVLHAGLVRTQPAVVHDVEPDRFAIAAWNHHYYKSHRNHAPELRWVDRLLAGEYDAAADRARVHRMHIRTEGLVRSVSDRFPMLLRLLSNPVIEDTIEETEHYFDHRRDTGRDVREVVKAMLRPSLAARAPILVIGHSLGSVIAWDTLWELTHEEALDGDVTLLTLGSPLGMRFVQSRLLGNDCTGPARYPHMIDTWHNVAAKGDLIALDPTLADDFAPMLRMGLVRSIADHHRGVYTHFSDAKGLNPHRDYGYLVNPVVSACIAAWLWHNSKNVHR